MRPTWTLIAIGLTLAGVAPSAAHAQTSPNALAPFHPALKREHRNIGYLNRLEWKVRDAAASGLIPDVEAQNLLAQLGRVQPIAFRDEVGTASSAERMKLDQTLALVENAISRDAMRRHAAGYADRSFNRPNGDQPLR